MVHGMARALFVADYARAAEDGRVVLTPEQAKLKDWMEIAPPTPLDYIYEGHRLAGKVEQVNGQALIVLFAQAVEADGKANWITWDEKHPGYAVNFGHNIAMQAVGHGVSWFDDHNEFDLHVPGFETGLDVADVLKAAATLKGN
jgi:hypothetical protein